MKNKKIIYLIIAVVVVIVLAFVIKNHNSSKQNNSIAMRQSVFLTNGQVYFGYLTDMDSQFLNLSDVFYLKTDEQLQAGVDNSNRKISLIKLGGELHGPEDHMKISKDQILFYENMSDNSKINDAIAKFKAQGTTDTTTLPSPTVSATTNN